MVNDVIVAIDGRRVEGLDFDRQLTRTRACAHTQKYEKFWNSPPPPLRLHTQRIHARTTGSPFPVHTHPPTTDPCGPRSRARPCSPAPIAPAHARTCGCSRTDMRARLHRRPAGEAQRRLPDPCGPIPDGPAGWFREIEPPSLQSARTTRGAAADGVSGVPLGRAWGAEAAAAAACAACVSGAGGAQLEATNNRRRGECTSPQHVLPSRSRPRLPT